MRRTFWVVLICLVSINALALDVTFDLRVNENDQKPILNLKTNLPPETILMASLSNPVNRGGNGYFGQAQASVPATQLVQFGPFSKDGNRLASGVYEITVSTVMAALQPEIVRPFFGARGERLVGHQVSTLPGTSERVVSQTLEFTISPTESIGSSPHDERVIGSADEVWQKVQSDSREIYVKMNGFYYSKPHDAGYGFHTYVVANLPESTIVGAPQSVMNDIEGNCATRTFHVLGTLFFAGKNRSGESLKNLPPEGVERKLVPNSPFEKAFDMLCQKAMRQK